MEDDAAHAFSMDDDADSSMCEAHEEDAEQTHAYDALLRSAASLEQEDASFLLPDDAMEPQPYDGALPEEVLLQLVYLYIYMYVLAQAFPADTDAFATPATGTPFEDEAFDEAEFVDASAEADAMDFEMR